jgi:hypothetical protein
MPGEAFYLTKIGKTKMRQSPADRRSVQIGTVNSIKPRKPIVNQLVSADCKSQPQFKTDFPATKRPVRRSLMEMPSNTPQFSSGLESKPSQTLEMLASDHLLDSNAGVFLEGEFYDVAAYWHIQIPCIFDAESRKFQASVEICRGNKFRFFQVTPSGQLHHLMSSLYPQEPQFDGSVVNVFYPDSAEGSIHDTEYMDLDF